MVGTALRTSSVLFTTVLILVVTSLKFEAVKPESTNTHLTIAAVLVGGTLTLLRNTHYQQFVRVDYSRPQ